jgi:hypothetical protein
MSQNGNETAIQLANTSGDMLPALSIDQAVQRRDQMVTFVRRILVKDIDFGAIPGTDKPTLLKPGAEKLCTFFGLTKRFTILERVEDWTGKDHGGEPFFYYLYRCQLLRGDRLIAESDGSANSFESKYRWRWVKEADLPPKFDKADLVSRASRASEPDFAVKKRETGGKYGKPAAYWDRFDKAIADGTAKQVQKPKRNGGTMTAWEIDDVAYRIPNDDIAGQVNTLQKMAQKRALIGTTLLAVNASEFFTQDIEDMAGGEAAHADDVIEGEYAPANGDKADGQSYGDENSRVSDDERFTDTVFKAFADRGFTTVQRDAAIADILTRGFRVKTAAELNVSQRQGMVDYINQGKADKFKSVPPAPKAEPINDIPDDCAYPQICEIAVNFAPGDIDPGEAIRMFEGWLRTGTKKPWDKLSKDERSRVFKGIKAGEPWAAALA